MENDLTPLIVRHRAAEALVTMRDLLKKARVGVSTFADWEKGSTPRLMTKVKIRRALEHFEGGEWR